MGLHSKRSLVCHSTVCDLAAWLFVRRGYIHQSNYLDCCIDVLFSPSLLLVERIRVTNPVQKYMLISLEIAMRMSTGNIWLSLHYHIMNKENW